MSLPLQRRLRVSILLFAAIAFVPGCSVSPGSLSRPATHTLSGSVFGGQQPIVGATIQLYTTSANGAQNLPLIQNTIVTDVFGNFNITADYVCPPASYSSTVYITATGGNPQYNSSNENESNPNIFLMNAIGLCSQLSYSTYLEINEATTVAAVFALKNYMAGPNFITESYPTPSQGLLNAFALAAQLTNPASGQSTSASVYTLANIIAACVNTSGGTSGDHSACGNLFSLTTPTGGSAPTDTATAMLNIANDPGNNVTQLFDLAVPEGPFQPQQATAPSSFVVP